MDLVTKKSRDNVVINVIGNIKSIVDGQMIKDAIISAFQDNREVSIELCIKDSFIITSSVIGFLIKSIKIDKMPLYVSIGSQELYEMLVEMSLIEAMNIRKVL